MSQSKIKLKIIFYVLAGLMSAGCFSATAAEGRPDGSSCAARFDAGGDLIRPVGYREWIFVGAPVTPNDMNNGNAAFPEFHNVYIDPESWAHWKKTGEFRDCTLIVKELVSVGAKQAASGQGYFQGAYIGLEAMLKSRRYFADAPGHWGFFRFTIENSPELRKTASVQPEINCLACHHAKAAQDHVFIQYYPVLRAARDGVNPPKW